MLRWAAGRVRNWGVITVAVGVGMMVFIKAVDRGNTEPGLSRGAHSATHRHRASGVHIRTCPKAVMRRRHEHLEATVQFLVQKAKWLMPGSAPPK
jgi:hypothetical protein